MPIPFPGAIRESQRNTYDDEIPFYCVDCGEDFTIEGYVEDGGDEGDIVIPAAGGPIYCPNDKGMRLTGHYGDITVPTHDVEGSP